MRPLPRLRTVLDAAPLYLIFAASGVAGLGYQIVWTRMLAVGLGHEIPSVLAVVAAFFGGLALGAALLDRPVSRSPLAARWYAGLELTIGLWGLLTIWLLPWVNQQLPALTGPSPQPVRHWTTAFAVPCLALLPATAAMGATLPAMDRFCVQARGRGRVVGGVYAANTFGAVLGTLGATFWLVPALGHARTLIVLAVLNGLAGLYALRQPGAPLRPATARLVVVTPGRLRIGTTAFLTGLLGIGYEVLGVRVMSEALENTVYTFAGILAVYLLGTAVGAAIYQRTAGGAAPAELLTWLLQGLSIACLLGIAALSATARMYEALRLVWGAGMGAAVAAEMAVAALVFFLPCAFMGATFSHLAQTARRESGGVGWCLALNTLGGACSPPVLGLLAVPQVGSRWALLTVALAYLVLIPAPRLRRLAPLPVVAVLAALLPREISQIETPPGGRILERREGVLGTVAVVEDGQKNRLLKINNRFQQGGTGSAEFAHLRQGHLPLLLHPRPQHMLHLGLGAAVSFSAARLHPEVRAEGVELVPQVLDVLPWFESATGDLRRAANLRLIVADARRYVRATPTRYDVIVADLYHPAQDGAAALYTAEHFRAVAGRLSDGGLFCQWLPLYQLDRETFGTIARTFLEVWPATSVWMAHFNAGMPIIALVGESTARRYPAGWSQQRVRDPELANALIRVALRGDLALFGGYMGSGQRLRAAVGPGPLNTDDHPVVLFQAPRFAYGHQPHAWERLRELLIRLDPQPEELLADDAASVELGGRLRAYWRARDRFLEAQFMQATDRPGAVDRLLDALEASREFRPAYELLLAVARHQLTTDRGAARQLLLRMRRLDPDAGEVATLLRREFGE